MMRDYCTYFDSAYLGRGLALYQSMKSHCAPFRLFVLCLDETCYEKLAAMRLPEVSLIRLSDFEAADASLAEARKNRTRVEYYFTCTPCLPLYVLRTHPKMASLVYLDADLFFFSDPDPIFKEIGTRAITIIPHRFSAKNHHLKRYGLYNVGWVSFTRDPEALACLSWWRERCLEWCRVREDEDRYADQKYLDRWPSLFKNLAVLTHKGANLAPWNVSNYRISVRAGHVFVDDVPLIFFHFHGFSQVNHWLYYTNLARYRVTLSGVVRRHIYVPYMRALAATGQFSGQPADPEPARESGRPAIPLWARLAQKIRAVRSIARRLTFREYLLKFR